MEETACKGDNSRAAWPIVIGGCHRSGTSLLRRVLNAHSRIHCGPEIKFFRDFYGDYFDDPLAPYRFASTARAILPEEELVEVLGRAFVTVHERAARRVGKPRWADKAPENVLYLEQWQRLLGDEWLLVHVVRNPLDTLASMNAVGMPLTFPPNLDERIEFYRRYTESGLDFAERQPKRYLRVVYEELTASPQRVLGRLMAWLGEALEPQQREFNEVAHQPGLEDPGVRETNAVHADSVDRWRTDLAGDKAPAMWAATEDLWKRIDPGGEIWSPGARLG
ncbi:MAG TPA: sulfotransferase [Gaiellaceae bacterium]